MVVTGQSPLWFPLCLRGFFVLVLLAACAPLVEAAETTEPTPFLSWAKTPPMGWNSWDCYGPTVTEAEVRANADYMAEHLKQHGWQYVVVDIRWYIENDKSGGYNQRDPRFTMDEYGRFWPAENRFPSAAGGKGFKPLADYIHSLGLKFGIHLMRGIPVKAVHDDTPILGSDARATDIYSRRHQCTWLRDMYTVVADRPGAQQYYDSVINLYASWGIDYIKIDDLSRPYHAPEIELIRRAIDNCGRPIVLSMSPGATPLDEAEHAKQHANLWRISDDFWDRWDALLPQFERCRNWAPHSGPGHWPDADMLPLGRIGIRAERGRPRTTGFTRDEQITLMTLWSIFRSPLMFGGDLPSNDEWTQSLLTNDEVLAVNQYSTGGRELFHRDGHVAWIADVPDSNDKYVALFNVRDRPTDASAPSTEEVAVTFDELGLASKVTVRDLWAKRDVGDFTDGFSADLPFHGAGLYRFSPHD
jgi:alpha-galactosidase